MRILNCRLIYGWRENLLWIRVCRRGVREGKCLLAPQLLNDSHPLPGSASVADFADAATDKFNTSRDTSTVVVLETLMGFAALVVRVAQLVCVCVANGNARGFIVGRHR